MSGTVNNNKTRDFLLIAVGRVKNPEEPETSPYLPSNRKLAEDRRYLNQIQRTSLLTAQPAACSSHQASHRCPGGREVDSGEPQAYKTLTFYKEAANKPLAQKERFSLLY